MTLCSGKVIQIGIACYLIHVGFAVELKVLETVNELLNHFNAPLKLTITPRCWDVDTTVKFVRYINNDPSELRAQFLIRSANVTEATVDRHDRHQEVVLIDVNCGSIAVSTISKISRQMFNVYKIIVFDSSVNSLDCLKMNHKIHKLLQESPILPNSQFFFICRDFGNNFAVKQVYRIGLSEPLIVEEYATYTGKQCVAATTLTSVLRRRNFHGFLLKASMVITNNDSLHHLDDYRDLHIDAEPKLSYQLTKHLISFVNGTVTFSIVPTWGYNNKSSGEWTGMMGQVIRNEADIGATALFFTAERTFVVEYIARTSTMNTGFIFMSPKLSYTNNLYALPFERLLWLCLLVLVLVLALCLVVAVIFELNTFASSENRCSVSDVPIVIFGALCQQGSAVTPNSMTGRMIMILSFIALMFLFVSYAANIVALLQSPSNRIRTLQDLYDTKMGFSMLDTPYNRHYFATETEPFRKKFYEDKFFDKNGKLKFSTLEDGIKKVREGQYAFFTEHSGAFKIVSETFMDVEKCGLKIINFFQMKLNPWYAIQKNSSYKEIFKIGMMRIHEHGLNQREHLRHILSKPKCSGPGGGNFVSANLIDTRPAISILLWGFAVSFTVFIFELILPHQTFPRSKLSPLKSKIKSTRST